jgi:hypothetical protein
MLLERGWILLRESMSAILTAFLLSLIAGLVTGLGGLIVVIRKPVPR